MAQKLQHRVDEQCEEIASFRLQLESTKEEAKHLCEQQKDKAVAKVMGSLAGVSWLGVW